jgi:long-chain acyl-CoA synthetase
VEVAEGSLQLSVRTPEAAAAAAAETLDGYARARVSTLPALLDDRARRTPGQTAYRAKHRGCYREQSWSAFRDSVYHCACGLQALGLARGERVAIMGDACPEWITADLAAQACGAITYGIYPTASVSELAYQLEHGGASLFIAENQEYVDKVLAVADRLPALRWIVVVDSTAMFAYDHPKLRGWAEVLDLGRTAGDAAAPGFARLAAAVAPEDPAFIVYTSGTTGHPKGALIGHGRHLAATYTFIDHYPLLAAGPQSTVAFLPLGHIIGRCMTITLPLLCDLVPHFGEEVEALPRTLFEVAPTVLMTVPRYLQKFAAQVLVSLENTTPLKRAVYDRAMHFGRGYIARRWAGELSAADRAAYAFYRQVAFRPILNQLGLDRVRLLITGGAPLPRETGALWQIWGVNVVELYGQTETGGAIIAGQRGPFPRPGDVGSVPCGWQVELGDDGEILVSGPDPFLGYWQDPEATAASFDAAGRLHTGDVGAWDDGRLKIVDRAKDIMTTSGGKTLSPTHIENTLRGTPYISEIAVFGHARKYISALVEIDYDTVADWARTNNVAYTGFTSLAENPRVIALLEAEIARLNGELARVEQVKAFRILPKALDPEEEGEPVTPTRKVKREQMYRCYQVLVESMYADDEQARLADAVGSLLHDARAR